MNQLYLNPGFDKRWCTICSGWYFASLLKQYEFKPIIHAWVDVGVYKKVLDKHHLPIAVTLEIIKLPRVFLGQTPPPPPSSVPPEAHALRACLDTWVSSRAMKVGDTMSSDLAMGGNLICDLPTEAPSQYHGDEAVSWAQAVWGCARCLIWGLCAACETHNNGLGWGKERALCRWVWILLC